jgi:hypothetical protein
VRTAVSHGSERRNKLSRWCVLGVGKSELFFVARRVGASVARNESMDLLGLCWFTAGEFVARSRNEKVVIRKSLCEPAMQLSH